MDQLDEKMFALSYGHLVRCTRGLWLVMVLIASVYASGQTPPPLLARPPEASQIVLSDEQARKVAISKPKPDYPIEAQRRHLTGKGVYQLNVSELTGEVASVDVLTSAGYPILDNAAIKALKQWRFKPHSVVRVKVPIAFVRTKKSGGAKEKT